MTGPYTMWHRSGHARTRLRGDTLIETVDGNLDLLVRESGVQASAAHKIRDMLAQNCYCGSTRVIILEVRVVSTHNRARDAGYPKCGYVYIEGPPEPKGTCVEWTRTPGDDTLVGRRKSLYASKQRGFLV